MPSVSSSGWVRRACSSSPPDKSNWPWLAVAIASGEPLVDPPLPVTPTAAQDTSYYHDYFADAGNLARLRRWQRQQERTAIEAYDPALAALERALHTLTQAELVADGYRAPNRQWRRKRGHNPSPHPAGGPR